MKKILFITLAFLTLNCSGIDSAQYEIILKDLSKNYTVKKEVNKKEILFCWNVTEEKFKKDSLDYIKARSLFYKQDKLFIDYLIKYKNDSTHYNNWIETKNPCSSTIDQSSLINNSYGALILIDNFLINKNNGTNKIEVHDYLKNIKYEDVEKILESDDNLEDIRINYLKYIKGLK